VEKYIEEEGVGENRERILEDLKTALEKIKEENPGDQGVVFEKVSEKCREVD
jgi:hypothetical protein